MYFASYPEGGLIRVHIRVPVDDEEVPGLFFVPEGTDESVPLVLIQHPATSSKDDYFVADVARLWAARGWICGGFDAPFHGDRAHGNPVAVYRDPGRFPELRSQYARELSAVIDGLASELPVEASRLGFVGYSLGSMLGLHGVAKDGRFRAAVFCLVGEGGIAGTSTESGSPVPELESVAVRIVGKRDDELISAAATEALFAALPGKKDLLWLPGGHFELGPDVTGAAAAWMRDNL